MNTSLLEHCLFPIASKGVIIGQGFIADGFLITAAHVIKGHDEPFIIFNDGKVNLLNLPSLYIGEGDFDHNPKVVDVAVWALDRFPSPLHLSTFIPNNYFTLKSCMIMAEEDSNSLERILSLSITSAYYVGEEDNYFYCKCDRNEGSSGSPLLLGNNVVGVMHGGKDKVCCFLKISSFIFPQSYE